MRRLLAFSVLALCIASPAAADMRDTTFVVRPGHPTRVVAANDSHGDSNSLTWAIVKLDGMVAAVDLEQGEHARTETIVRMPGVHHATVDCGNYHASTAGCTITPVSTN